MDKRKVQKGQTLVELLVAIALFATVSLLALNVFVNVTRMQGRIALENAIYEDARFMMERIAREIRSNTVDYEEYFNKGINTANQYGDLFGCYAAQFYNPGSWTGGSPDGSGKLGAFCNDGKPYTGQESCVVYKPSVDNNTGVFPYVGNGTHPTNDSNAFCPKAVNGSVSCTASDDPSSQQELYLIDKDGQTKTIFAAKKVKDLAPEVERALAMIKIKGLDSNNDGVTEKWRNCGLNKFCCAPGFDCEGNVPTSLSSLEGSLDGVANGIYSGFVPISPLRTNLSSLNFVISPVEDPRKAFAEGSAVASQPKVTIILTVRPTQDQLNRFGNPDPKDVPTLTLQTTVSSRIQSEVKSYMGSETDKIGGGLVPASATTTCPLLL